MPHDVFISYCKNDKHIADAACATLENLGVRCWFAPRDIQPGEDWAESIIDALNSSIMFVLIFSAKANESPQVQKEVERAINKGIPVIPFRVEDVEPSKSLKYFLSTPHWLDAMTPPMEWHLERLGETIQMLISRTKVDDKRNEKSRFAKEGQVPAMLKRPPEQIFILKGLVARRWMLIVLLAVALSGVGSAWILFQKNDKEQHDQPFKTFTHDKKSTMVAQSFITKIYHLVSKGDYTQVITECDKEIKKDCKIPVVYAFRALARIQKGDPNEAIADSSIAIRMDTNCALAYAARSFAFAFKYDLENAFADGKKSIDLDPGSPWGLLALCSSHTLANDPDKAIEAANDAIRLNPTISDAFAARALAYLINSENTRALTDANQALNLNPDSYLAYFVRSIVHIADDRFDDAQEDAEHAIDFNPRSWIGYSARGIAY